MAYVVEKADGTEIEKNAFSEVKPIFDRAGIRLWKRTYYKGRVRLAAGDYTDELVEAKPGYEDWDSTKDDPGEQEIILREAGIP